MLHAVILAGGSGKRFWPLSRKDRPKQFLKLAGSRTLIQQSYDRLRGLVQPDFVYVVTNEVLAAGVRDQLGDVPERNVIAEPQPKDTAIAMGLAAGLIQARDPEAVLVVSPSDHVIRPGAKFREAIREAVEIASSRGGGVVTFGIPARSPHTGYGYIRRAGALEQRGRLRAWSVAAFEEKPDPATAERYVAEGEHYWNSGIFVWSARTLLDALSEHLPETRRAIDRIVAAWDGPDRAKVLAGAYEEVAKISIDYAVLEKARDVVALEADFEWSDVGSWAAIPGLYAKDDQGNTVQEAPFASVDAKNCLVYGDGRLVAVLGLEDVIVVQTRDATLVCHRDRAEEVKQLVERLEGGELEPYT